MAGDNDDLPRRLPTEYGDRYADHVLEQYKLYVELADRAAQRRNAATTGWIPLLLNIVVALVTVSAASQALGRGGQAVLTLLGILICLSWFQDERRYRALAVAKYAVIARLEKQLPFALEEAEWQELQSEANAGYFPRVVVPLPIVFAFMHLAILGFLLLR
jgi:hypothetical protein